MNTPKPDIEDIKARVDAAAEDAEQAAVDLGAFLAEWRHRNGIERKPSDEAAE